MPRKEPTTVPRRTAGVARRNSSLVSQSWPTLVLRMLRDSGRSRLRMISAMPNMPMAMGTKPMPSDSSGMPKVKRCWPVCTSVPTRPRATPSTTMPTALMMDPCARTQAMIRPSSMSEK